MSIIAAHYHPQTLEASDVGAECDDRSGVTWFFDIKLYADGVNSETNRTARSNRLHRKLFEWAGFRRKGKG